MKRSGAVVIDFGQEFTNVQGLQNFLGTLDAKSRYVAQMHVLDTLIVYRDRLDEFIESFYEYVRVDASYLAVTDVQNFTFQTMKFATIANKAREKRNRKAEAKKTILNAWGNEAAAFIGSIDSCTMLAQRHS